METIVSPAIPYLGQIVGNFTTGKTITIEGMVIPPMQRIIINLQTGEDISHKDDIALQLSVRLLQGKIARNSMIHGLLGTEETSDVYPLTAGEVFKVTIQNEYEKFVVTVNDSSFSFLHRLPYSRVNHIAIQGDVKLDVIEYEQGPQSAGGSYDTYRSTAALNDPREEQLQQSSVWNALSGGLANLATMATAAATIRYALTTAQPQSESSARGEQPPDHSAGGSDVTHGLTATLNAPRAEQQQEQLLQSSGWGTLSDGLANLATIATAVATIYALTTAQPQPESPARDEQPPDSEQQQQSRLGSIISSAPRVLSMVVNGITVAEKLLNSKPN